MTCESARKEFPLYLYGELPFDQEERVEQHLDSCESCRRELEREKRIHRVLDLAQQPPSAELLEQCRQGLARAMAGRTQPATRRFLWPEALELLLGPPGRRSPAWLRPVAAAALVLVGFAAARFTSGSPSRLEARLLTAEPVATQVRYIEPADSGEVRIVVEETRQRVLSGRLDEATIRQLLLRAVRDPSDPGVRAESIELLRSRPETEEVRQALLYALANDPNDGVRLKALEGLRDYATDAETRKALSRVLLNDRNPGIRAMAIDLLVESRTQDIVGTLQQLLLREDNSYVRLRSQEALREMNASVETF